MRRELQEIEIIENYLIGKMNATENTAFEKQLETDANLAKNVELQKGLVAGLQRMGLKNDLLKAKRSLFMHNVWRWFGVALLLTGLAFAGIYYLDKDEAIAAQVVKEMNDEGAETKDGKVEIKDTYQEKKLSDSSDKNNIEVEELVMLSDIRSRQTVQVEVPEPDFAEIPVKQFQTFKIDPTIANILSGEEGTIIEIPAAAFDTESNQMVTIQLKEYYTLSDMVFANLTTQTNEGQLIETGGMVYIEARQASKANLKLAADKAISLKFPFEKKKEGMQTFAGEKDGFGNVVWEEAVKSYPELILTTTEAVTLPKKMIEATSEVFTIIEDMPIYPGCESNSSNSDREKCTNTKVIEFIKKNIILPANKTGLEGETRILIKYKIDEFGFIQEAIVLNSTNKYLNNYAIATVKSLPQFIPGKQRNKPVRVQYTIPIKFNIEFDDYQGGMTEGEVQRYLDSLDKEIKLKKEQVFDNIISDTIANSNQKQAALAYYTLSSSDLGFINCDSYPLAIHGKSSFNVFENDEEINCSLVLHAVRGIVKPTYIKQGKYIFPQLPNRTQVSVLAFKSEDKKNYVSYYQTNHNKEEYKFDFVPLTKEKLEQITAELNSIRN